MFRKLRIKKFNKKYNELKEIYLLNLNEVTSLIKTLETKMHSIIFDLKVQAIQNAKNLSNDSITNLIKTIGKKYEIYEIALSENNEFLNFAKEKFMVIENMKNSLEENVKDKNYFNKTSYQIKISFKEILKKSNKRNYKTETDLIITDGPCKSQKFLETISLLKKD